MTLVHIEGNTQSLLVRSIRVFCASKLPSNDLAILFGTVHSRLSLCLSMKIMWPSIQEFEAYIVGPLLAKCTIQEFPLYKELQIEG